MTSETISIDAKQLKSINSRLDAIIRMVSLSLPDSVSEDRKVEVLSQLGFQPAEIGPMVGMTPNAVSIRLSRMKKKESNASNKPQGEKGSKESTENGQEEGNQPATA